MPTVAGPAETTIRETVDAGSAALVKRCAVADTGRDLTGHVYR